MARKLMSGVSVLERVHYNFRGVYFCTGKCAVMLYFYFEIFLHFSKELMVKITHDNNYFCLFTIHFSLGLAHFRWEMSYRRLVKPARLLVLVKDYMFGEVKTSQHT